MKMNVDHASPLTHQCPYCDGLMTITRMSCHRCGVSVEARFPPTRLSHMPIEHQRFIEMFVLAGGSLKEIAEQTGVSYPTVRSRLDKVIAALHKELKNGTGESILTPEQKAEMLKNI